MSEKTLRPLPWGAELAYSQAILFVKNAHMTTVWLQKNNQFSLSSHNFSVS